MSRTYRKAIRQGVCTGSNTEYYRARTRKLRRMNRQSLHTAITKLDIADAADVIYTFKYPRRNEWDEPTDGSYYVDKNYVDSVVNSDWYYDSFKKFFSKYYRVLKNKHVKHSA